MNLTTLVVFLTTGTCSTLLLAASDIPDGIVGPAGFMLGGCFAIWHSWYMTTRVMPEEARQNREQLAKFNDAHLAAAAAKDETHRMVVESLVTSFNAATDRLITSFDSNAAQAFLRADKLWESHRTDLAKFWDEARAERVRTETLIREDRLLDREARHALANKLNVVVGYVEQQLCDAPAS